MKRFLPRKPWQILLLGSLMMGAGFLLFRSEPPFQPMQASAQFLAADSQIPPQPVSLFERVVPFHWSWLWRARDYLRGPRATILLDARIIDCTRLGETALEGLLPERAFAETNGLRGWVLESSTLTELKRELERNGCPVSMNQRVQTAHTIQSRQSVGSAVPVQGVSVPVGVVLDLLPLIQRDGTELMSVICVTGAVTNRASDITPTSGAMPSTRAGEITIVTNLNAAARWQLPEGTGLFMLGPVASKGVSRLGVIITAKVQRPKK